MPKALRTQSQGSRQVASRSSVRLCVSGSICAYKVVIVSRLCWCVSIISQLVAPQVRKPRLRENRRGQPDDVPGVQVRPYRRRADTVP